MESPFRKWLRPQDALSKIAERIEADLGSGDDDGATPSLNGMAAYRANYLYVEKGNHWQGGAHWPVNYPTPDIARKQLAKVQPMFCAVDAIGDGVGRQRDALTGREITIEFQPVEPAGKDGAPSEAQVRQADEARAWFANWWDAVGLWDKVRKAHDRAAWGKRGPMRVRFLPGAVQLDEVEGAPPRTTLTDGLGFADALAKVTLSAELPKDALLYTDPETEEQACIIRIAEDGKEAAEVWFREGERVVRRILHADNLVDEYTLPPTAGLPLREVTGELLVTAAVRQQQAQINYTKTILTRVMQTAGHREKFALGIEEPGEWSLTPPPAGVPLRTAADSQGNALYFHPGSWETGPEIISIVQPRIIDGGDKGEVPLDTEIVMVDPVDPEYVTKALESQRASFAHEIKQGHAFVRDMATSGEKQKQDRADFQKRVESYKQSTELAVAGVLTSAGRNALLMTKPGDPMIGFFDRFRIVCTLHIDTGPLSADEIRMDVELAEKGIKPRAQVMASAGGVEDFDVAEDAIKADPIQRTLRLKDALDVAERINNIFTAGAAVVYLRGTGLADEELLAALARSDVTVAAQ